MEQRRSTKKRFSPSASILILLLLSIIVMADRVTAKPRTTAKATAVPAPSGNSDKEVHIVYMQRPPDVDPEAHDLQFLSSIVGSEEAAKEAMLYSYKAAASGFSANLTPKQVEEIKKREGVLQVAPSKTYQLHSGSVSPNML